MHLVCFRCHESHYTNSNHTNSSLRLNKYIARDKVISHDAFLTDVAQNVNKTSQYLHITGNVTEKFGNNNDEEKDMIQVSKTTPDGNMDVDVDSKTDKTDENDNNETPKDSKHRIDEMIEPKPIPLNAESCPIPHSTAYVTVNRNHYIKDDKKLRYIPQISNSMIDNLNIDLYDDMNNDSDTEFEEQEDILLDYIYENLELDDETTINNLQKIFYLSFERIQHRIMVLSHHKQKLLKEQKDKLLLNGYDTKNKDIPIDSFSLLFCPRCMTYDCSLHGLDNPRRRNRALPSDIQLREKCDYFGIINKDINDPNALAKTEGNHSICNYLIPHLLPKEYKPSVIYPDDLSQCEPCNDGKDCYITFIRQQSNNNGDKHEWSYMDCANLRRLLNVCKKNFCQIAAIMGNISCKNVYLKAKEIMPDLQAYVSNNDCNDIPKARKQQVQKTDVMELRKPIELNAENIPHQFFGCKHDGPCTIDNNCSCIINKTHCEKFCNCEMECTQRFPGCACKDGKCQTDECPCFQFHRECDPDKCKSCQSYLPSNIVNLAIEWLKENAIDYYNKHYLWVGSHNKSNKASSSSSSLMSLKSNDGDENKEKTYDENTLIEIEGIPNINPFKLCDNNKCTLQRKKKLWIGRSDIHGFGCFAGENVKKDEYITEYLGEMISQIEADRRGKVYDEQNISYLFNLNEEYCIDATRKGCKMKFANHSIKPNCRAKIITVNGDHRICIYAKRDLAKGEELLFDYRHDTVDNANAHQPNWFNVNHK